MITLSIKDKTASGESPKLNSFGFILVSICLIACFCYLARAVSINEFTRVEPCFSECAREMLQRQNYIVPLYHGMQFFDKPILTYWLIVLCYKVLGVSVFAARLPSIISAILCIGLVATFARKIYGNFAGILAGTILATSIGFSDMASTAMSDMLLCLFEFISLITLYLGCENSNKRTFYFCIASVAMSLGFLTKSLIALAFPIGTFLIFLILYKMLNVIKLKHLILGISIFAIIVLPWHIMVYKQCGINALNWMYLHEQIQRFSTDIAEYNFRHPFYYITLSLLSQLLPWSIFLPVAIWKLVNDLKQNFVRSDIQCTVMLLIFVSLDIVLFTLSKSNWGYYNLPACPAMSIIIGKYFGDWLNARSGFLGKYKFAIPASIFVGMCVLSLVGSWSWTMKLKHEAQHNFAEIITNNYPKNEVLIHMDLFAQYFLCDWILFKTQQTPKYYYHNNLLKVLTQHKAYSVILPKNSFDMLPESLKDKLKILAVEQYKFIPFKLSPLKQDPGTDCKTTLVLATNK
jgi:4-amino-4-deoxy-L-arabinose transferase-like glycosyltransferase